MTIYTALKKIDTLNESELNHCIQRLDDDIRGYLKCTESYDKDKFRKYGVPYLDRLKGYQQKFIDQLDKLNKL